MLRRKKADKLHARRQHDVDIALTVVAESRVIGDQSHAFPFEFREILPGQYIETRKDVRVMRNLAGETGTGNSFVISSQLDALGAHTHCCRCYSRHSAAQRSQRFAAVGMN